MPRLGWKKNKRDWRDFVTEQPNGCISWNGTPKPNGYCRVRWNKRNDYAHRAVFRIVHGDIPDGAMVLHHCDNRQCVNPEHLYLGDHAQNMADMRKRERSCKGRAHPLRRLTPGEVLRIRTSNEMGKALAAELGISPQHLCQIRKGRHYADVK